MKIVKPKRLNIGDEVGIIAPSSGMSVQVKDRFKRGIDSLKKIGFRVKIFDTSKKIRSDFDWESSTAKFRAKDITKAFLDREIKAIICAVGGNTANKILPLIDYKTIRNNPKIFCGYSDATVLHQAFLTQSKMVTFYGPAVLTQFAEYPKPLSYTIDYFMKALSSKEPIGKIHPSKEWTDEVLDWFKNRYLKRPRRMKKNEGFTWIKEGEAEGKLIGGCLHSLTRLAGTKYASDFSKKILILETPEGEDFRKGEPLAEVDAQLNHLRQLGAFDRLAGLVLGRPFGYSKEQTKIFKKILIEATEGFEFPILFGVDIGHTDPIITLPLGVKAKIDSKCNLFEITERGVI